jgi:hypothetical protein
MQRLITEDSANPQRVEAAMTVTTYGRRMASTLAAIAEARARDSQVISPSGAQELIADLDTIVASLEGSASPLAPESVPGTQESAPPSDAGGRTLQDAQIYRLRAQLAVLRRAVIRYETT